jgi:hypothetical protein
MCSFFRHRCPRGRRSIDRAHQKGPQFVEALDMMNKKFANPYIIYYPVVSRDGMPFPVNRTVRDIQEEVNKGRRLREDQLWRGHLVAAKFADDHFTQMIDASMADFPILKNFLGTHASPAGAVPAHPTHPNPTHPSPPPLPTAPLPPPHHPVSLTGGIARQMQPFNEHASAGLPQAYERDPSAHVHAHAHAHGVPMGVPAPRREPKPEHHHHHHHHQPMDL